MSPEEPQELPPMSRNASLIVVAAFVFSVVIYIAICFLIETNKSNAPNFAPLVPSQTSRQVIPVVALFALLASSLWIKFRTAGRSGDKPKVIGIDEPLMSREEFQTEWIVALALSELCVVSGLVLFFMGGPARGITPYAAGTAFVDLVVILPVILRYWAEHERREGKTNSPFN